MISLMKTNMNSTRLAPRPKSMLITRFHSALQLCAHQSNVPKLRHYSSEGLYKLNRIITAASPVMPPKSKKRAQDYDSDGGFVADENGGSKSKKQKTGKVTGLANQAGSKDAKKGVKVAGGGAVSSNGETFWEVGL